MSVAVSGFSLRVKTTQVLPANRPRTPVEDRRPRLSRLLSLHTRHNDRRGRLSSTTLMLVAALVATSTFAADPTPDDKFEKLVRQALPVCADMKISTKDFPQKLPAGMKASVVTIKSSRPSCVGQFLGVTSPSGSFFLGAPWLIGDEPGATIEEKVKSFAWSKMQESMTAVVDRNSTREGLFPITLYQVTERGKVPMSGLVDRDGKAVFVGNFYSPSSDASAARLKAFEPFLSVAPTRGAAKPEVTIVEFSDFQCPSCRHSAHYAESIIEKHGDSVRYVRYDLPLVSSHPWALGAALAGRAVYKQKPELFWDFKKQIYANQDKLSAFTFYDFARAWAQDHDLDLAKYDADIESEEVRNQLLKGVGAAFSNEVRATPTYMVNGVFVDAGDDGKALEAYVEKLLKKS